MCLYVPEDYYFFSIRQYYLHGRISLEQFNLIVLLSLTEQGTLNKWHNMMQFGFQISQNHIILKYPLLTHAAMKFNSGLFSCYSTRVMKCYICYLIILSV